MAQQPQQQNSQPKPEAINLLPPRTSADNGQIYSIIELLSPTSYNLQSPAIKQWFLHLPKESNAGVFTADWQQKELGADVLSALFTGGNAGAGAGADNSVLSFNSIYNFSIDVAQGAEIGGGGLENARRLQGLAKNPANTLLFQAANLRNMQFTWDFMPINSKFSQLQNALFEELRLRMHPRLDSNTTFLTPYLFRVKIVVGSKFIVNTLPCAMTNLTINPFAAGVPAFHKDGSPVHTAMTIELQEIVPQTQQSINYLYGKNRG